MSRRHLFLAGLGTFVFFPGLSWSENAPALIAVYGDSQAEGLAAALLTATRGSHFHVINRTKAGTALGQPTTYDWVAAVQRSVSTDHPAIAVMMFGGNDRVPAHPPDGRALAFRSDPWLNYYRDRLQKLVAVLTGAGIPIVWCGSPNTRDSGYAKDMAYLNQLYQDALGTPDATYVDIWDVAAGPNETYVAYGPGTDGVVQRLRTDDGIHFTAAGYGLVAKRVLRAIEQLAGQKLSPAVPPPPTANHANATDVVHTE